jgi:hypothetical protein
MTKDSGGATINPDGASKPTQERSAEFAVDGNISKKAEKPSLGTRGRGDGTSEESGGAVDMDTARDRAG